MRYRTRKQSDLSAQLSGDFHLTLAQPPPWKGFSMHRRLLKNCAGIATVILTCIMTHAGLGQTVTLDPNDRGGVFEGIGAVSAGASSRLLIDYPEPQRSQILDYLFKPGFGAALQHLKVEIGGDVNSTDGSEPSHMRTPNDHDYTRGYEWWLMEEAKKRNPEIELDVLPWGAPGWVGEGNIYSADMVQYVVDFIKGAKSAHDLTIDYVGIWNERMYDGTYVKALSNALKEQRLSTKIVCCDSYPGVPYGEWSIIDAMAKDSELNSAISVVGVHYPRERNAPQTPASALGSGKQLWSSEDQPNPGGGPFLERDWPLGGHVLAKQYISNYLDLHLTATEIWSPVTAYFDSLAAPNSGLMYANTPWSGHYDVQSTIWVSAHTSQFTKPGWQYLDHACGRAGDNVSYVALQSPDKRQWSVILETIDALVPTEITFEMKGSLVQNKVYIWETNDTRTFEKVADVNVNDGRFTYQFEPGALYSLTTTTGQGRQQTQIPAPKPFPFPYEESFENVQRNRSPRFLADQNGAYEVEACEGRQGNCLTQQITQRPIPWMPMPNPFTLTGDNKWRDYSVEVDFRIPAYGAATIMGRIDSANVFEDRTALNPSGYVWTIRADGNWQIASTSFKHPDKILDSGNLGSLVDAWHHVRLSFRGGQIVGEMDKQITFSLRDADHMSGQIALGSSWSKTSFDNLKVSER